MITIKEKSVPCCEQFPAPLSDLLKQPLAVILICFESQVLNAEILSLPQ